MEQEQRERQRNEAFDTMLGRGRRTPTDEERQDAQLMMDKLRMDDNDPFWWFIANQTVGKPDPGAMIQLAELGKAIESVNKLGKTIDSQTLAANIKLLQDTRTQVDSLKFVHDETLKSLNAINGSVAKSVAIHEKATNHLALWAVQKLKDHHLFYVLLFVAVLGGCGWWWANNTGYARAVHTAELCNVQGKPLYFRNGSLTCDPPKAHKGKSSGGLL
ncbi:hypothetical protein BBC27_05720 [Acidithiobacillus ferrivorans]|uniref:Uncharacterized protein n=1 Tax=Acidithiobacillus ferrivorans TaxID=160808 RepID=A0A1B9C1X0_9PROT|nr:hypothetical protein [Acidithiobacillus ferrivorans]OCB03914.1 hypothetical protein BBC27_05720 [Acidithiobacillus ferrivorans]